MKGKPTYIQAILVAVVFSFTTVMATAANKEKGQSGPLVLGKIGSFFVGGRDLEIPYRSNNFISDTHEQPDVVKIDQMYVNYMLPAQQKHRTAVVFVHGAWHTGKTWEETPDGREGWAVYFTRQGFKTYWVDEPWRGRSAFNEQSSMPSRGERR